ncbi:STAS domain-containing protein [Pseudonocardia spinosispora]|uniref:STAS domain-containing protein n=1 Tax=Pseudonocardia spinosispora TaxID=103441 RepID=UPI0005649DF3|nr:STAS domain-containing protein [Pseudonocardia spinosispora]
MSIRGSSEQIDGQTVLTIAGKVDTAMAAAQFEYLIAHAPGCGRLVLDLTDVSAFGRAGAAVLARTSRGDERGLAVVIGERHDAVLRAAETASIMIRVRLFDSLEYALAAAESNSATHRSASRYGDS